MVENQKPVSVVLPVYNEADIIESIILDYYTSIVKKIQHCEFIVAEDGSDDGTKEILLELSKKIPMQLTMSEKRKGYLQGVKDALQLAKNEIVFFSDSDGQHEPNDFWKLFSLIKNYDIVCGIRTNRNDPIMRKILSKAYNNLIEFYLGVYLPDTNAGFKMMKKKVVESVVPRIQYLKYGFSTELIIRANATGYKIAATPIQHIQRKQGVATQFTPIKMPRVVLEQLKGLRDLKKSLYDHQVINKNILIIRQ